MAQENTLLQHRLFINKKEILTQSSGSLSIKGDSRINRLSITLEDIDIQHDSLYNKPVELYLEEANEDNLPIFRGFVKRYTPTEKKVNIEALDVRTFLTGNDGIKITSTDEKNYDGKTVGQFLHELVVDKINYDKTLVDVTLLNDMDKPLSMTGFRGSGLDAYQTLSQKVRSNFDDDDLENILGYSVDIKEGPEYSGIVFIKDKRITDTPSYTYSYNDGLVSLKHKEVKPPNTAYYNDGRQFKYTNRSSGQSVVQMQQLEDVAETRNLALRQILYEQNQNKEIDIIVSKGYDVGVGSIVFLDVDEDNVYGAHRVTAKEITFGKGVKCILKLNKKPIKLSEYIKQD